MEPLNLNELNSSEFKQFLDSFDHVFSDCDGVAWVRSTPLKGAEHFYKLMQKHGKTVHFVSNNSLSTRQTYEKKFRLIGVENGFENLTIPSFAIVDYFKSINFNKKAYCIACTETIKVLQANGFECKEGPNVGGDSYTDYVQYLEEDPEIGAVVLDSDFKVNLPKLYQAITYLRRPEVLFIIGASDRYVPFKAGCLALGIGAFCDLVVEETKRQPIQLGKPGKLFGKFAMKRAGVTDPGRVLFIGDMIDQDIGLGKAIGFKTLLVLTNNTKEDMLSHKIKPDYFADSLGSLVSNL